MALILVCDDDAAARQVIECELAAQGHEVLGANDGFEATELAQQRRPDLIFLAENTPVFTGYEACERLRDDPDFVLVPIVLLASDEPDPRRSDASGFTEVFVRESSSDELRELVVRLLGPLGNPLG